ncbi:phospholipase A1 [bacterium A37T11]|nr:phospholipase A1 [bacterium A37T11]
MHKCLLIAIFILGMVNKANSQFFRKDSLHSANDELDSLPAFTMHKDNYFITGTTLKDKPSRNNSDIKYQISFKQRLRVRPLPGNLIPFLLYTQKAFWDIFKNSKPFDEINFNPGFALVRPFYFKGYRQSYLTLSFEHESNGRDSIYSRSWNYIALSIRTRLNKKWILSMRGWIPFSYQDDNPDLLRYIGYGEFSATYKLKPNRWSIDMVARKGSRWDWKGSIQTQLNFRPFKSENEYIMLQWFHGFEESLIDYHDRVSMLRLGFVLKANQLNVF